MTTTSKTPPITTNKNHNISGDIAPDCIFVLCDGMTWRMIKQHTQKQPSTTTTYKNHKIQPTEIQLLKNICGDSKRICLHYYSVPFSRMFSLPMFASSVMVASSACTVRPKSMPFTSVGASVQLSTADNCRRPEP